MHLVHIDWYFVSLQQRVSLGQATEDDSALRVESLLEHIDAVNLLVVCQREQHGPPDSQQQVIVVALPRQVYFWRELDQEAMFVAIVGADPGEVVGEHGGAQRLLAQQLLDLVKLQLMEDLARARHLVFVKTAAIYHDLNVRTLHIVAFVEDRGWLRCIWTESPIIALIGFLWTPSSLTEDCLVQFVLDHCRVSVLAQIDISQPDH